MVENNERAIKNGQSRETGNIDDEKHNTICAGQHNMQRNTTTTQIKKKNWRQRRTEHRTEHRFMWKSQWTSQHRTRKVKTHNSTTRNSEGKDT